MLIAAAIWMIASRAPQPEAVSGPLGLGLLPVLNLSADEQTGHVAAAMSSLLVHNLDAVPSSTVTRLGTGEQIRSRDKDALVAASELGVTRFIDLSLQRAGDGYRLEARLLGASGEALWRERFEGDLVRVQAALLSALAAQLETSGRLGRPFTPHERERFLGLPTTSAPAVMDFAAGRSILDSPAAAARADDAIARLERAVAADGTFVPALAGLAAAYRLKFQRTSDRQWLDRAQATAQSAIAADATRAEGHLALASVLNASGRAEEALAEYRTAISLAPSNDDAHRLLGRLLADRGQLEDGVAAMRRAVQLSPESWNNHYTLAFVFYNAARYRDAVPHLRRVTELEPGFGGAYAMLGTIHHRLDELPQAVGYYEHAVRISDTASAHSNLGTVYYAAGRFGDALAAYERAAVLDSASATTRRNIGDAHQRLGNTAAAAVAYEEAITLATTRLSRNPRDAQTLALQALCEAKLGRRAAALRHAAEALVLSPDDREVLYKQAVVFAQVGESTAAIDTLRRAFERGYERRLARADDDLQALRELASFRQLTADP
jgi:serine/threonine-protein kinase